MDEPTRRTENKSRPEAVLIGIPPQNKIKIESPSISKLEGGSLEGGLFQ